MSEPPPPPPISQAPPPPPPSPPPPAEKRRRGPFGDAVGLPYIEWTPVTVLLGVMTAIGIMIVGTAPVAIADPDLESVAAKDIAQLMVGVAFFFGGLIFALTTTGGKLKAALRALGFRDMAWRQVGLGLVTWLFYLVCAYALTLVLDPQQEDVTKDIGGDDGGTLAMIIAGILIIVIAPISEEVFFRGFMFAGLRRRLPIWGAAIISGAVWGSLHLSAGNVDVAIQLTIFGVILAYAYEQSGSLWTPIVGHTLNNAIAFIYLVTS